MYSKKSIKVTAFSLAVMMMSGLVTACGQEEESIPDLVDDGGIEILGTMSDESQPQTTSEKSETSLDSSVRDSVSSLDNTEDTTSESEVEDSAGRVSDTDTETTSYTTVEVTTPTTTTWNTELATSVYYDTTQADTTYETQGISVYSSVVEVADNGLSLDNTTNTDYTDYYEDTTAQTIATTVVENTTESETEATTITSAPSIEITPITDILSVSNAAKSIYFDQLTEKEQNMYNLLVNAVLGFKSTVDFDEEVTSVEFTRVFTCAYLQNPELFWWSGRMLQSEDMRSCTLFYMYSPEQAKSYQAQINKKVSTLTNALTTEMSDLQKAIICHNWLCLNNVFSKDSESSCNIYGSLVGGIAQCEGYAKGYLYLMNKIGIPCLLIPGLNKEGNSHAWCKVYINGEWTNIDPTFDDSIMEEPVDYKNVSYRYCGVPDVAIYDVTHFEPNVSYLMPGVVLYDAPACTTYNLNADINYGYYASTYEEAYEKLKAGCFKAVEENRRCAHVKIATDAIYLDTLDQLVTNYHIFDIKKEINAEYGANTISEFAIAPENKLNYIEVTMTYGS